MLLLLLLHPLLSRLDVRLEVLQVVVVVVAAAARHLAAVLRRTRGGRKRERERAVGRVAGLQKCLKSGTEKETIDTLK